MDIIESFSNDNYNYKEIEKEKEKEKISSSSKKHKKSKDNDKNENDDNDNESTELEPNEIHSIMVSEILSSDIEVLSSLLIFFRRNCSDYCDLIINHLLDIFFEFSHYTKLKWDILKYHAYFMVLFERYFNTKSPVDINLTLPHLINFFIQFYRDSSFTRNPVAILAINSTVEYFAHLFILQKADSDLIPKFLILFNCILFRPSTLFKLLRRGYCNEYNTSRSRKPTMNNNNNNNNNAISGDMNGSISNSTIITDHHNHSTCNNICFLYYISQFLSINFTYQVRYLTSTLLKTIFQILSEDEKYILIDLIPLKSLLNILSLNKLYIVNQFILHIINERLDFGKMPLSSSLMNEKYKWKGLYYNNKVKSKQLYIISDDNILYIYQFDESNENGFYDILPQMKLFLFDVEAKKIEGGIEMKWKITGVTKIQDLTIYINNEADLDNCFKIINDISKCIYILISLLFILYIYR